jgi:hypothetical protein
MALFVYQLIKVKTGKAGLGAVGSPCASVTIEVEGYSVYNIDHQRRSINRPLTQIAI